MSRCRDVACRRHVLGLLILVTLTGSLAACTDSSDADSTDRATSGAPTTSRESPSSPSDSTLTAAGPPPPTATIDTTASNGPTMSPPPRQAEFRVDAALRTVRTLALRFGPREAASPAYHQAADWVEQRFRSLGYDVRQQRVHVPAGISWGVEVDAGTTTNVIATSSDYDPTKPHLVVSAHLDTVPQAPGAEDDASGVSVLLELAGMASVARTRLPVVFVAFGGEEPRGDGDGLHHFGSRAMVNRMSQAERDAVVGMVSMDRVGVGTVVPVCTAGTESPVVRGQLLRAADHVDVPTLTCVNASSDHESFEDAGMPAARVGGTSYAAYHSAADLPHVVSPSQLGRVGSMMWAWMRRG